MLLCCSDEMFGQQNALNRKPTNIQVSVRDVIFGVSSSNNPKQKHSIKGFMCSAMYTNNSLSSLPSSSLLAHAGLHFIVRLNINIKFNAT